MSPGRKLLVLGAVGAVLTAVDVLLRPTPFVRRRELSGMGADEPDEEPPPGLVYDDRAPCQLPQESLGPGMMPRGEDDDTGYCIPPADLEPIQRTSVAFAEGGTRPMWPVDTDDEKKVRVSYQDVHQKWHGKWGRHFGTGRRGDDGLRRLHAGVDVFADEGDVITAMEDGEIVAILPYHHGSYAVYVRNDSGIIVNYGEVGKNTWQEFGIESGVGTMQRVQAGDALARIGRMSKGSSMLHLETFRGDTKVQDIREGELRWLRDEPAPPQLLDPTRYLVRAQRDWFDRKMS